MEFCAEVCDRCALFFDGEIISENEIRKFFEENRFYTTVAKRVSDKIVNGVVKLEELIEVLK